MARVNVFPVLSKSSPEHRNQSIVQEVYYELINLRKWSLKKSTPKAQIQALSTPNKPQKPEPQCRRRGQVKQAHKLQIIQPDQQWG
eukprot:4017783-Amphidinium_carterae.1